MSTPLSQAVNANKLKLKEQASDPVSPPPTGYWYVYPKAGGLYVMAHDGTVTGPFGAGGGGGSSDPLELVERATPGAPAANHLLVYAKDDGGVTRLYYHNSDDSDFIVPYVFTELFDVTGSYAGAGGKVVAVTMAEDGLEFVTGGGGGGGPVAAQVFLDNFTGVTGTWGATSYGSQRFGFYLSNTATHANGDAVEGKFSLAAGTYDLDLLCITSSAYAMVDVSIDGVVVGSVDLYSAGEVDNAHKTLTSVVVATDGIHTLRLTANGKNGASSSYYILVTRMDFQPH